MANLCFSCLCNSNLLTWKKLYCTLYVYQFCTILQYAAIFPFSSGTSLYSSFCICTLFFFFPRIKQMQRIDRTDAAESLLIQTWGSLSHKIALSLFKLPLIALSWQQRPLQKSQITFALCLVESLCTFIHFRLKYIQYILMWLTHVEDDKN